ncbi:MAG: hypothetical protein ACI8RZ_003004 [Myxococcota bacterium]|jgi:hypothetical protein
MSPMTKQALTEDLNLFRSLTSLLPRDPLGEQVLEDRNEP